MLHYKHKQNRFMLLTIQCKWTFTYRFTLSTPQREWPMFLQQCQKCASLAERFLFTLYKSMRLTASSHCLAASPATNAFNSHMRLNVYYRNLKWNFVAMLLLRNQGQF